MLLRWTLAILLTACGPAFYSGGEPAEVWESAQTVALHVRLRTPTDEPASGVWVSLSPGGRDAQTDEAGEARFEGLDPGAFTASFTVPGTSRQERSVRVEEDTSVTWSAEAPPEARVRGQVLDAEGVPVWNAAVRLAGQETTTDSEGAFELASPGEGRFALTVEGTRGRAGRFSTDQLDLTAGADAEVWLDLPGQVDPDARPIGTEVCALCHADEARAWEDSGHAHGTRTPSDLAGTPLSDAIGGPASTGIAIGSRSHVDLTPRVDGSWLAVVYDDRGTSRFYDVERVIGGRGQAAALTAWEGGEELVLPVAWALPGEGLGDMPGALVGAWTEGWVDEDGWLRAEPAPATWDRSCAGCHTTGGTLVDGHTLEPAGDVAVEDHIGCEACHGDGSDHRRAVSGRTVSILEPSRLDGAAQLDVCARCHARVDTSEHPFDERPGWPVTELGRLPPPTASLTPDRQVFPGVPASRVFADQVGDLRASPHHAGEYRGACTDCHVPHGSEHEADLRTAPRDDALCTTCHRELSSAFAQADHSAHKRFAPGPWAPGACVDCHLPRGPLLVRPDVLSGVGEQRSHTLTPWSGHDTVAAFDEAGTERLSPGEVAVPPCLDCHLQAAERLNAAGLPFLGPVGDPYVRATHANLGRVQDAMWGSE